MMGLDMQKRIEEQQRRKDGYLLNEAIDKGDKEKAKEIARRLQYRR